MEQWWNDDYQEKNRRILRETCPVPLRPAQIPHGLIRERTRASAVRGQRLTARAMARHVIFIPVLGFIFNLNPDQQKLPNLLKQAATVPAFKKGINHSLCKQL
jgi:hypothetical protein